MENRNIEDRVKSLIELIAAQVAEIQDADLNKEITKSVNDLDSAAFILINGFKNATSERQIFSDSWQKERETTRHCKEALRHIMAIID